MDSNVSQPLNGDMTQALTNSQELLWSRQWSMKQICKTTTRTKNISKHCSSCCAFGLEASRDMPDFFYPATKVFCLNWYW